MGTAGFVALARNDLERTVVRAAQEPIAIRAAPFYEQRFKLEPACPQAVRSTVYDLRVPRVGTPAPAFTVP